VRHSGEEEQSNSASCGVAELAKFEAARVGVGTADELTFDSFAIWVKTPAVSSKLDVKLSASLISF
jgi:hypothetical protein